jgi:hypothetical protein
MNYSIIFIIAIFGESLVMTRKPDSLLDKDWKDFKIKHGKDYKNNKTDEDSRFFFKYIF